MLLPTPLESVTFEVKQIIEQCENGPRPINSLSVLLQKYTQRHKSNKADYDAAAKARDSFNKDRARDSMALSGARVELVEAALGKHNTDPLLKENQELREQLTRLTVEMQKLRDENSTLKSLRSDATVNVVELNETFSDDDGSDCSTVRG